MEALLSLQRFYTLTSIHDVNVAVLLATYNGDKYLAAQMSSLLGQVAVSVDVYISDDDSNDNTINLIQKYRDCGNVHLINTSNWRHRYGRSAAINFYSLIASGAININAYDWFAFADQDDIWMPEKLIKGIECLIKLQASAYSSSVLCYWEERNRTRYLPKAGNARDFNHYFEGPGPGCTFILRSSLYVRLQEFVKTYFEMCAEIEFHDWFVYAYAKSTGHKWYIDSNAYILYRQHSTNVLGFSWHPSSYAKKIRLLLWWYPSQVKRIISVLLKSGVATSESCFIQESLCSIFYRQMFIPFQRRRLIDQIILFTILPILRFEARNHSVFTKKRFD